MRLLKPIISDSLKVKCLTYNTSQFSRKTLEGFKLIKSNRFSLYKKCIQIKLLVLSERITGGQNDTKF